MPKKGTRIASSQAKAQERARRKAHRAGPVLPAAAYEPPVGEPEEGVLDAELEQSAAAAVSTAPAPASVRRSAPSARREHAAAAAIAVSNVRNELLRIGAVTVVIAGALAALKFGTSIGA